ELEQPTPRDVDGILVTQGFRDLVDDARGILTELIAAPPNEHHKDEKVLEIDLAPRPHPLEITQLTGAICPSADAVYRPGLLIVYTGPGKGKTTCALGTAFRAVGQGLRVMMVQFIKGSWHYGELDAAKMLGNDKFKIRPMGRGFVKIGGAETDPEDIKLAHECWEAGREAIYSGKYDLVVLDEINYTISYKMLDPDQVVEALKNRPERVHVIC